MKAYIVTTEKGTPEPIGYTSLKVACGIYKVSYASAVRGKRLWVKGERIVFIHEVEIEKIKGRGINSSNNKQIATKP
jgi:hypothetical protein